MTGDNSQEVDAVARPHEEGELCQALDLALRCPGLIYPGPTTTSESESESESEGAKAALPEEQAADGFRQEGDAAARSHEEGQLCQAPELSLHCQGLLYPELVTTSESESEKVEDALPFCPLELSLRCPSLSNLDLTATSHSEQQSESEGGEAVLIDEDPQEIS